MLIGNIEKMSQKFQKQNKSFDLLGQQQGTSISRFMGKFGPFDSFEIQMATIVISEPFIKSRLV